MASGHHNRKVHQLQDTDRRRIRYYRLMSDELSVTQIARIFNVSRDTVRACAPEAQDTLEDEMEANNEQLRSY